MKKKKRDIKKVLEDTKIEIDDGKLRCKECEEELTIPLEYRQQGIIYYIIDEDGDFHREGEYSDEAGSVYCPNCLINLHEYDEEKTKMILQYLKSIKEMRKEEIERRRICMECKSFKIEKGMEYCSAGEPVIWEKPFLSVRNGKNRKKQKDKEVVDYVL